MTQSCTFVHALALRDQFGAQANLSFAELITLSVLTSCEGDFDRAARLIGCLKLVSCEVTGNADGTAEMQNVERIFIEWRRQAESTATT